MNKLYRMRARENRAQLIFLVIVVLAMIGRVLL